MGWRGRVRGKYVLAIVLLGLAAVGSGVRMSSRPTRPLRPSTTHAPLAEAASAGDLDQVRQLVAQGSDLDAPTRDGATALLWATARADSEMMRVLIEAGASVDRPNRYGVTPLLQAARAGDADLVEQLLAAGARVDRAHPLGQTPLIAAAHTGVVASVTALLKRGADVNAADTAQQQTALMWAAAEGHLEVVDRLLDAGAKPNAQAHAATLPVRFNADFPSGGFTALMWAARNGHAEVVWRLLDGGADPTLQNADGATASVIAIVNDRLDIAATLIDRGADVNDGSLFHAVEMHDATSDMYALDGSRLRPDHPNRVTAMQLVERLLERGADPNKPMVGQLHSISLCCGQYFNATPFYRAALAADVAALRLMIARGANLEWVPSRVEAPGADGSVGTVVGANDNVGRPAIQAAMAGGNGALVANGPGVHDREGPPPFREPSSRTPSEALALLLEAGANPNAVGPDGSTALHQAVQSGRLDDVRLLARAGAALDARNRDGLSPLELAAQIESAAAAGPGPRKSAYREAAAGPSLARRHAMTTLLRELDHRKAAQTAPALPATDDGGAQ